MIRLNSISKLAFSGIALLAFATGAVSMSEHEPSTQANRIPLCGPSLQWSCSKVGGPAVQFNGTFCDKWFFERKTGLTCVPLGK